MGGERRFTRPDAGAPLEGSGGGRAVKNGRYGAIPLGDDKRIGMRTARCGIRWDITAQHNDDNRVVTRSGSDTVRTLQR